MGSVSAWDWFLHGSSTGSTEPRHPVDLRDFGFVPIRFLGGVLPMTVGLWLLLQRYPSSRFYHDGYLWRNPLPVLLLSAAASLFMFITPLVGMAGPDPGWNEDPKRINYSISHMIDSPWLMFVTSFAWTYPASLVWAMEYREDWLRRRDPKTGSPGGFLGFLHGCRGNFSTGPWRDVVRRIALWVWQVGFLGFLAVTDSTWWAVHMSIVNVFAAALFVHALTSVAAQCSNDRPVRAQCCMMCSAAVGLVAFLAFCQPVFFPRGSPLGGYGFWLAEVWALSSVVWFTPARLFCDEDSCDCDYCDSSDSSDAEGPTEHPENKYSPRQSMHQTGDDADASHAGECA